MIDMIDRMFSNLENWFKSRDYKCAYLIKGKEWILAAYKNDAPTPILAIYRDKQRIDIGLFYEDGSGCISLGYSEFAEGKNLDEVIDKIQALQKEIYTQAQTPYLDELMRRRELFTDPYDILCGYAQKWEYSLDETQVKTTLS